jgi:hypothetical protein
MRHFKFGRIHATNLPDPFQVEIGLGSKVAALLGGLVP